MTKRKKAVIGAVIAAIAVCTVLAVLFITNRQSRSNKHVLPDKASWRVAEVVYSLDWNNTENRSNAPQYNIDGGCLFWNVPEPGQEMLSSWTEIGELKAVGLDSEFDTAFGSDGGWEWGYKPEKLKSENDTAYIAQHDDMKFWLLFQKNGDVYLCRQFDGYGIRWVQLLERTDMSALRYYVYSDDYRFGTSLTLNPEKKTFVFTLSVFADYLPIGTYDEAKEYIFLTVEDGNHYMFKKSGDNLIFDAESSSEVPKYKYRGEPETCLPDGAVLRPVVTQGNKEPIAADYIRCELAETHLDAPDPYVTVNWTNLTDTSRLITISYKLCLIHDGAEEIVSEDGWMQGSEGDRPVMTEWVNFNGPKTVEYHFYDTLNSANPCLPGHYRLYLSDSDDLYIDYTVEEMWPDGQGEKWFDRINGDGIERGMWVETEIDGYPGVTFRCNGRNLEAVKDGTTKTLFGGMDIDSVYFCDITGNDKPEICVAVSVGQDLIGHRILVYDYENGRNYAVEYVMTCDYTLNLRDGALIVEKRVIGESEVVETGTLTLRDGMFVYVADGEGQ